MGSRCPSNHQQINEHTQSTCTWIDCRFQGPPYARRSSARSTARPTADPASHGCIEDTCTDGPRITRIPSNAYPSNANRISDPRITKADRSLHTVTCASHDAIYTHHKLQSTDMWVLRDDATTLALGLGLEVLLPCGLGEPRAFG